MDGWDFPAADEAEKKQRVRRAQGDRQVEGVYPR